MGEGRGQAAGPSFGIPAGCFRPIEINRGGRLWYREIRRNSDDPNGPTRRRHCPPWSLPPGSLPRPRPGRVPGRGNRPVPAGPTQDDRSRRRPAAGCSGRGVLRSAPRRRPGGGERPGPGRETVPDRFSVAFDQITQANGRRTRVTPLPLMFPDDRKKFPDPFGIVPLDARNGPGEVASIAPRTVRRIEPFEALTVAGADDLLADTDGASEAVRLAAGRGRPLGRPDVSRDGPGPEPPARRRLGGNRRHVGQSSDRDPRSAGRPGGLRRRLAACPNADFTDRRRPPVHP